MKREELTKEVKAALADVDWSGHWPDQIDGKRIGPYEMGCDRSYPNWEGGRYIGTLFKGRQPCWDIVHSGGDLVVLSTDERD